MEKDVTDKSSDTSIEKEGFISQSLYKDGIPNQSLPDDHIGIENISVEPSKLYEAVSALRNYGFNYLQCQGCLLYTSPSPRDPKISRMPSSA